MPIIAYAIRATKIIAGLSIACLVACASPSARFHEHAKNQGYERVDGGLAVYRKGRFVDGEPIHIYLDGDGTPAMNRGRITLDPTSRNHIILALMDSDPHPSALVGRPCYYGTQAGCEPKLWTTARYSSFVVQRLRERIEEMLAPYPNSPLVLVGYSGGGALAMLIAPKLSKLSALVTIAANIDTDAWVAHHGYAPLSESLNPALQPALDRSIRQFHYFGANDANVPIALMRAALARESAPQVKVVEGFDHECCWPQLWQTEMQEIVDALKTY